MKKLVAYSILTQINLIYALCYSQRAIVLYMQQWYGCTFNFLAIVRLRLVYL